MSRRAGRTAARAPNEEALAVQKRKNREAVRRCRENKRQRVTELEQQILRLEQEQLELQRRCSTLSTHGDRNINFRTKFDAPDVG